MGLFDNIGDAEIFERGKYLNGGFRGVLEVKRTIAKETIKSGIGFIVEFAIVETNMPDPHPVGSKATWFQKMSDKTVAFPSIKAFAAAVAGYESHQTAEIDDEVSPHLQALLQHATDNPADNDLVGQLVRVETEQVKTRNDRDFTRHTWGPYVEREEHVRDAVDEIAG
jgi:hypothetical protein